jgi:SAM-dependent methyltransferase
MELRMNRKCPVCARTSWDSLFEYRDPLGTTETPFTVIRCKRCGLVSYEPLPDEQTLSSYYPAQYYAFRAGSGAGGECGGPRRLLDDLHLGIRRNWLLSALLLPLLWYKEVHSYARFLRPLPRGRLLDVGCGDGAFLAKARRMGFECYGIEPGGAESGNRARSGIRVSHCSLLDFEGYEGFFDCITLNHVFEHLLEPEESLRKIRTLLRPGGRVLIRMPRTDHFLFRRYAPCWPQLDVPRHVYLYDAQNLERLAGRCGFGLRSVAPECLPIHYQCFLKKRVFGRPFTEPHWMDAGVLSAMLLPVCGLLNLIQQADSMAIWLVPVTAPGREDSATRRAPRPTWPSGQTS